MKNLLRVISLLFIMLFATTAYSQETTTITTDALFNQLKKIENAEHININSFMMSMARMMADEEEKAFFNNINSMRIIELNACSPEDKEKFVNIVSTTELRDYEPAQENIEENERTRVYVKIKNDIIKEIVIAQLGESDFIIMQINGKLNASDLEGLSKSKTLMK